MSDLYKAYNKRRESVGFPRRLGDMTHFTPTKCYTAFSVSSGVYAILESRAWRSPLGDTSLKNSYMLVSHGFLSHRYSFLDVDCCRRGTRNIGRPLAIYTSPSKYMNRGKILDLSFDLGQPAQEFDIALPPSAYTEGHVEFCACEDYRYEWHYEDIEQTGIYAYHLWRHRFSDGQVLLIGRISPALFRSPVDGSSLWTLELDTDRLRPEIAFLSAFMVKRLKIWPTLTRAVPSPPRLALNLTFEDEGVVIQRESKYFADWEAEMGGNEKINVQVIKVFNPEYLSAFDVPPDVLQYLEVESNATTRNLRDYYGAALN